MPNPYKGFPSTYLSPDQQRDIEDENVAHQLMQEKSNKLGVTPEYQKLDPEHQFMREMDSYTDILGDRNVPDASKHYIRQNIQNLQENYRKAKEMREKGPTDMEKLSLAFPYDPAAKELVQKYQLSPEQAKQIGLQQAQKYAGAAMGTVAPVRALASKAAPAIAEEVAPILREEISRFGPKVTNVLEKLKQYGQALPQTEADLSQAMNAEFQAKGASPYFGALRSKLEALRRR